MINIHGNSIVIGDADGLIALVNPQDFFHEKAIKLSSYLLKESIAIIYPDTAIAEAITTFQRKLSYPKYAELLLDYYKNDMFTVEYIDEAIMRVACGLFDPYKSKQNTFFDAIVAATAKTLSASAIFSFDSWYRKKGFLSVSDFKY